MAQNFTKYYKAQVTTAAHTLFTANTTDAIIGIRLTNITASAVTVKVWVDVAAGGATADVVYIAKDLSIPPNSSVELIQGGAKIVIASSDLLRIESSAATSIAAYISVVDAISDPP